MTATIDAPPAPTEASLPGAPDAPAKTSKFAKYEQYQPNRREALFALGGALLGGASAGGAVLYSHRGAATTDRVDTTELSGLEARDALEAGNRRFMAGETTHPDQSLARRASLVKAQKPMAAVFSCADSRVPPELVFDQGLGDLFVVRSAGQVVDNAVLGSLQYGVEHLEAPLLVVMGHTSCGAVKATIENVEGADPTGTAIDSLVTAIKPAVVEAEEAGAKGASLLNMAIAINVERTVEKLKGSPLIAELALKRKLKIAGAVYDLKTGQVEWL